MIRLLFFILLISCGVRVQQDEVRSLVAPDNKILVIEEGKSVFKDIGEVLDSNQVARLSDIAIFDTASIYSVPTQTYILTDTFAEGDYILTRNTGAWYKVQADSVTGYTTDSLFVIPTGSRYAIYTDDQVRLSAAVSVNDTSNIVTTQVQKVIDFAISVNRNIVIDRSVGIDAGLTLIGAENQKIIFHNSGRIHQTGVVAAGGGTSTGNYSVFTISNCRNVVFESPYITGENPANYILGLSNQSQAFHFIGSSGSESRNIRFNNIRLERIIGSGFFSNAHKYFKDVVIDGGSILDCAKTGINTNIENIYITNLRIERCRSGAELAYSRNAKFENNYVKNMVYAGIAIGGDTGSLLSPSDSSYITDIDSLDVPRKHEGNIVRGNTFWRCGISLTSLTDNGNTIQLVSGSTRSIVESNTIYYSGREGILVQANTKNVPVVRPLIINNRIINASLASSSASKAGIFLTVPSVVMGNTIEKIPEDTDFNMNRGISISGTNYPIDSTDSPVRDSIYVIMNNLIDVPTYGIYAQGHASQPIAIYERDNIFIDAGLTIGSNAVQVENPGDGVGKAVTAGRIIFGDGSTIAHDTSALVWDASKGMLKALQWGRFSNFMGTPTGQVQIGFGTSDINPGLTTRNQLTASSTTSSTVGLQITSNRHYGTLSSPLDWGATTTHHLILGSALYLGGGWRPGAQIRMSDDGTAHGASSASNQMTFWTSSSSSGNVVERMRIDPDGEIGINITDPLAQLHVGGDLLVDDYVRADSIILNGLSIISGTAAPAAGLGSQGSLYMRDDDDSTLYTKTATGWVLLN